MGKKKKRFTLIVAILLVMVCTSITFARADKTADAEDYNADPLSYSHEKSGQDVSGPEENRIKSFPISRSIYEQVRAAEEVYWCGGRKALLKNGSDFCLIDLQTGESDSLPYVLQENDEDFRCSLENDWIKISGQTYDYFFNVKTGFELDIRQDSKRSLGWETWTDPTTGRSVLLLVGDETTEVYDESGERLNRLEWDLLAENANYNYITNGRLLGNRKQDGCAVIRDVLTGEDLKVFAPGWTWRYYEENYHIFEDGTAILDEWDCGEHMVIDLDGQELIRTSLELADRFPDEFYRLISGDDCYYLWDQITCEFYYVSETKVDEETVVTGKKRIEPGDEIPKTVYIPETADGGASGKYAFIMPKFRIENWNDENGKSYYYVQTVEGELMGAQLWSDICHRVNLPSIEYSEEQYFIKDGFLPVKSMEGKWGVLASDGHMILPAEFDRIIGANTGCSTNDGYFASPCTGFIAWKDEEIGIYDLNGRPVFAWRNYLQDSIMK